jgi:hypothetical protein
MKTDLYTKFVLTVIALALSTLAVQHTIPSAFAQANQREPIKVLICDPIGYEVRCANVSYGALKVEPK